ncbi:MAG: hypothetical protein R3E10_17690 [Gemmatimonadota bacterium]
MKGKGNLLAVCVLTGLGATGVALLAVSVGVVRQGLARPESQGLEYATLLHAIDELVQAGPVAPLHFVGVDTVIAGRRIRYDTLVVEASAPPSLGSGGFLHGEVLRYNRFQREWIRLAKDDPAAFERIRPYNPSLFRPERRPDGSLGVTRTAAAWSRRVESPFDDEWEGAVRTVRADRDWGLSNPAVRVPLDESHRLRVKSGGRSRACEFEVGDRDARVYCLSEARTAQAVLRDVALEGGRPRLVAGWAPVAIDGVRLEPDDSLRLQAGAILRIEPLEPLTFGTLDDGVLSVPQWINGRARRRGSTIAPLDLLAAVGRSPLSPERPAALGADLVLSVDAELTAELTEELGAFARALPVGVEFGGVVLTRIPDGAVVALAETGERSEPGRSGLLQRLVPGSAIKPILAAAILSRRPELGRLEIPARSGRVTRVAGAAAVPASRGFTTELHCPAPRTGRIDLRYFLRCSNNEYAATLLTAALTGGPVTFAEAGSEPVTRGPLDRTVPRAALLRSAVTEGMDQLFEVSTDPVIVDARRRSDRIWTSLRFDDGSPVRIPYEVQPDASRPVLLASADAEETELSLLYRYAFGAWENRWNLFDLTEAFARIATDRRVRTGLAVPAAGADSIESLGLTGQSWYDALLDGLEGVAETGTAAGLAERWRELGVPGVLLAKTGTLTEEDERRGEGLYLKSLLFAVGEGEDGGALPLRCGVAGSVYLRFSDAGRGRSLPSYQVEFAAARLGRFLERHWERLGLCR